MRVLKFGGSSVSDAGNMSRVLDIVEKVAEKDRVLVVSSAISGCTDLLIDLGRSCSTGDFNSLDLIKALEDRHRKIILRLFSGKEYARVWTELDGDLTRLKLLCLDILKAKSISEEQETEIQTFGELLSTRIIAAKLKAEFFETRWIDSREIIIKGDNTATYSNIRRKLSRYRNVRVFVAPGFIARDADGKVTTLGRGGSDYSAALYAAALDAPAVEIWTDVPGIMTANPKLVPMARNIPHLTYGAAFCMAAHGAKVLYAPTVEPAKEKGIPIEIRNTFSPEGAFTLIDGRSTENGVNGWTGLSNMQDGDYEVIYICTEGDVNIRHELDRGMAALKDEGISAVDYGSGEGYISLSVLKGSAANACICLHNEFL